MQRWKQALCKLGAKGGGLGQLPRTQEMQSCAVYRHSDFLGRHSAKTVAPSYSRNVPSCWCEGISGDTRSLADLRENLRGGKARDEADDQVDCVHGVLTNNTLASSSPSFPLLVKHQRPRGSYWCTTPAIMATRNSINLSPLSPPDPSLPTLFHILLASLQPPRILSVTVPYILRHLRLHSSPTSPQHASPQPFNQITNDPGHDPINPHLLYRGSLFRACPTTSHRGICLCNVS